MTVYKSNGVSSWDLTGWLAGADIVGTMSEREISCLCHLPCAASFFMCSICVFGSWHPNLSRKELAIFGKNFLLSSVLSSSLPLCGDSHSNPKPQLSLEIVPPYITWCAALTPSQRVVVWQLWFEPISQANHSKDGQTKVNDLLCSLWPFLHFLSAWFSLALLVILCLLKWFCW